MKNNYNLFTEVLEEINKAHYILIVSHHNPDADTISCALAFSNYMYENKIKHKVFNNSDKIPKKLDFLSKFDKITNEIPKFYDLVIYVDCANNLRVNINIPENIKTINIDHHQSNTNFADINIVDYSKGSTAEVVFEFFNINRLLISKNIATCLYVGIYDDNIAFTTPRTDAKTFEKINTLLKTGIKPEYIANKLLRRDSLAKYRLLPKILNTLQLHHEGKVATIYLDASWIKETGASIQECDDVVNMVLNISIVEVVLYLRVINAKVRVSLRSKNINVSSFAKVYSGGGHINAAGLTMDTDSILEAKEELLIKIKNYI